MRPKVLVVLRRLQECIVCIRFSREKKRRAACSPLIIILNRLADYSVFTDIFKLCNMMNHKFYGLMTLLLLSCGPREQAVSQPIVNPGGATVVDRFSPPAGFYRRVYPAGSFQSYLRNYQLKPHNSSVHLYDGTVKARNVHAAVFDFPLLTSDLIQCADAVMKLRADYFYRQAEYESIAFTITNGMNVPFVDFTEGKRVVVDGNHTYWKSGYGKGVGRNVYDSYLKFIYSYAGTLSLSRELVKADVQEIEAGDVFIRGGSPGHAVLVIDIAENEKNEKIMLLGQSYMPSQEFHILKSSLSISPWYRVADGKLETPEWTFEKGSLMRFP